VYGADLELSAFRQVGHRHGITDGLRRDMDRDVETDLAITTYRDLDAALATGPYVVFICTPSSLHLDIARRAAAAHCHLFIEKPVSHSLDGLDELAGLVAQRSLVAAIGCQWRFHPCVQWLRGVLQDGRLGRLLEVDIDYAEYLPDWHPYEDYRTSYAARADLGGGVVLTQVHDYDLAWWLFGQPASVTASGGHLSELEIDVEDTVDARLVGASAPIRIRQTFASKQPRRIITVTAEAATVRVDLLDACVTTTTGAVEGFAVENYQRNQMFMDEIVQFGECLGGKEQPMVPLQDGIAVLKLALAVRQALRTGREISLS
jgi:predicted dehydrogenase